MNSSFSFASGITKKPLPCWSERPTWHCWSIALLTRSKLSERTKFSWATFWLSGFRRTKLDHKNPQTETSFTVTASKGIGVLLSLLRGTIRKRSTPIPELRNAEWKHVSLCSSHYFQYRCPKALYVKCGGPEVLHTKRRREVRWWVYGGVGRSTGAQPL